MFNNINIIHNSDSQSLEISLKFSAVKEKLAREKVVMINEENEEDEIILEVIGRVLGKGKGTPMLRKNIKCVEAIRDLDTETEASDWQGF